jgi:sarcosine oxidase subunit gamma
VARLIAKTPLEGLAPVEAGGTRLAEGALGRVTSVAPLRGREQAVAAALRPLGLSFPGPGETVGAGPLRMLWSGRGQALLIGAAPPEGLAGAAALTDQSDALAALVLEGTLAEAALARLVPLDLRADAFPEGRTARTMLFHLTCSVSRTGPRAFEVVVMRSMARTALHDLTVALKSVAAQG